VRVPDRELSIDEARELNVRLNKNVAEWDFDTLANNFELDDLLDWVSTNTTSILIYGRVTHQRTLSRRLTKRRSCAKSGAWS
jgi:hypothetical protein